jgi:endonuclease/exonuclease/phosphatase family metal-dependent hydrolase
MKVLALWLVLSFQLLAATVRVGTYNLELYVDQPFSNVQPKSAESRKLLREAILLLNADVLALQEMGTTNALSELQSSLKRDGLDYPYRAHVSSRDPHLHLAFLSKYPILAERHHTNESYLLQGKRHYVQRGFAEIEVRVTTQVTLTLLSAHLKSKRIVVEGDQQGMREEEAALLRARIDAFLKSKPTSHLIVLGDFNDSVDSRTYRIIKGRGRQALFDTRPAEKNGDVLPNSNPRYPPRQIVWTHFYAREEIYSRIDYILVSPSLVDRCDPAETYILSMPNWGTASDHRPLVATFRF